MIPILYTMIRSRHTQAFTMLLLAALAAIAALAGPAYLTRVDATVAARQWSDATAVQRTMEFSVTVSPGAVALGAQIDPQLTKSVGDIPGFATVQSTAVPVSIMTATGTAKPPQGVVLSRQDVCVHITVIRGRCMVGVAEVMLSRALANTLHLAPGDRSPSRHPSPAPASTRISAG